MPDITYSISLNVNKGSLQQNLLASNMTADISTAGMIAVTLNLGTAVTTVNTATMGTLGLCYARSLATETTHTVSFGRYSGGTLYETARLKAGEGAVLRLAPGDYAAKAAVAGSRLLLYVIED
jgi:hypothetical protein